MTFSDEEEAESGKPELGDSEEIPPSFTSVSTSCPCNSRVGQSPSGKLFIELLPCISEPDASEDDEPPRWRRRYRAGVKVKIHGLVAPLGRQLNGCVGTIVRVDAAAKRYAVNVDNFDLKSIKPENLELIIEPLNRVNSGG